MQSLAGRELSKNVAWNVIHRIEREMTKQHEEEKDACRLGTWGFLGVGMRKRFSYVFSNLRPFFSHLAVLCNSLY